MDSEKSWIFQNGSSAELLGYFDEYANGGTFYVQTENEDDVKKHRTILRGCSRLNNLVEAYLYVEVYNNKYPDFVEEVQQTFLVPFSEDGVDGVVTEYQLPDIEDAEAGEAYYTGTPLVYIEPDLDPANPLPPFMTFNEVTRTLRFKPNIKWL